MRKVRIIVLILIMCFSMTAISFAGVVEMEPYYKVFTGTIADQGAFFAWGVTFNAKGTYIDYGNSYHMTNLYVDATMDPGPTDYQGEGVLLTTVRETVDYVDGAVRVVSPTSPGWLEVHKTWPSSTHVYYCKCIDPDVTYLYELVERIDCIMSHDSAMMITNECTTYLTMQGPK